jgi:hypothetical protein
LKKSKLPTKAEEQKLDAERLIKKYSFIPDRINKTPDINTTIEEQLPKFVKDWEKIKQKKENNKTEKDQIKQRTIPEFIPQPPDTITKHHKLKQPKLNIDIFQTKKRVRITSPDGDQINISYGKKNVSSEDLKINTRNGNLFECLEWDMLISINKNNIIINSKKYSFNNYKIGIK